MSNSKLSIAVLGAGLGGLAAATLLARAGHQVSVYDQFDAPRAVGSGLMLQETGLAVLGALGLRDKAEALGAPIARLYGVSIDTGRIVLDVRYAALRAGLTGIGIQRQALFDLLLAAAMEAGARLITGVRVMSADPARAVFTDAGNQAHGPFALLIDALGVRSPLSSAPRHELPFGALWATLPWPKNGPFDVTALEQRYQGARKMTGVMPSGRTSTDSAPTLTYFWSLRADQYEAFRAAPLEAWKSEARALWPQTAPLLDAFTTHDDLTFARYRHRTHPRAAEGCLVRIGDSWHATSPQLGQGANIALLDAYALSLALADHATPQAALAEYNRRRSFHVRLSQTMSWAFTPVYQSDSNVLPWLRDRLAAPLLRLWPAPPLLALLVAGGFGAPLRALGLSAKN